MMAVQTLSLRLPISAMMTILVVISEGNPNRRRPKRKEVNMETFLVSVKERGIDILLHLVPSPYVICLMGSFP